MHKLLAVLQIVLALILLVIAAGTMINMVLIAMRPETISVVNTLIGQTLMIVCLVALGRILLKKGLAKYAAGSDEPGDA
jgi:hypothetical protein